MKTTLSFYRRLLTHRAVLGVMGVLGLLVAGCATDVNRLREAQDSFNQAASAENALRFDRKASDALASMGAVRSGYASALLSLENLSSKDEAALRQDGLWGSALTLKALTQWRLGQYDRAIATAEQAKQSASDQMYPRDRALIAALPGLVKTDQAYNKILLTNAPLSDIKALLVGEHGAVADIQKARQQLDREHPLQIYLIQAQLAAFRNYQVGTDYLGNHSTVTADDEARVKANSQLKDLDRLLRTQGPELRSNLVNYWVQLCILDSP